ncbi:MAG TPA: queuosine precursor transporter [Arenibaculum sp.]|nr:queuosine precursor transporter [Arenibaculum sp.]
MNLSPERLIAFLNGLPPELLLCVEIAVCFTSILLLGRLFGRAGLYAYIVVAVLGANVQVLKAVQFGIYGHPVALGTILFASSYLATDMLAEHYGRAAAQKGVMIGFATFLLWTVILLLTLGYAPLTQAQAGEEMAWALPVHDNLAALFVPQPAFFVAGMCAYLVSQLSDVWLYDRLRRATGGRMLWLRNNGSTMLSALIDNTVFSVLAWVVFAPQPIGYEALVFTYILGTYVLRIAIAVLDTPFMYLSRFAVRTETRAYA